MKTVKSFRKEPCVKPAGKSPSGPLRWPKGAPISSPPERPDYSFEKCYGVSKAGTNDCQTATHSCAGTSTAANQGDAWS